MRPIRRPTAAFTLVELMVVVMIIGILAAVAMPAMSRYTKKARTAEAPLQIDKLLAMSKAYYLTDHHDSSGRPTAHQFPGGPDCLPTGNGMCAPGIWETLPFCGCYPSGKCPGGGYEWDEPTWQALNYARPDEHNYVAVVWRGNTGLPTAWFGAAAVGDIDCDDTLARFTRWQWVDSTNDIFTTGPMVITNEFE